MLPIPFSLMFLTFTLLIVFFYIITKYRLFCIISLLGDFTGLILVIFYLYCNIVLFVYKISVK
jgi:hypothetical protein